MIIKEKQQMICGYIIGVVGYFGQCRDIYSPNLYKIATDVLKSHQDEFGLSDDEKEGLDIIMLEVLNFVRELR